MQLFSKMKRRLSVRVQTHLTDESYYPGELIQGYVRIESMRHEQRVDSLYLKIFTQFEKEMNQKRITVTYPIAKYKLRQTIHVEAGKEQTLPFTIRLPYLAPLSVGQARVWLQTELDLSNQEDPTHQTDILVTPMPAFYAFIKFCNEMGFRLFESVCSNQSLAQKFDLPFIQTFSFVSVQDTVKNQIEKFDLSLFEATEEMCGFYIQWFRQGKMVEEATIVCTVTDTDKWKELFRVMYNNQLKGE